MAATLTHTQTRSVVAGPLYRIHNVVTASVNIAPEVFVFRTSDQVFNRIATADDMMLLPATYAQAVVEQEDYYRLDTMQKDYESLADAQEAAEAIVDRLTQLLVAYDEATAAFVGTTTETLSS